MSDGASFTLGRLADALGASRRGDAARVVTKRVRAVEKRVHERQERRA